MIEVLGIIVGKNGRTIGAKFNWNGEIKLLKKEDLKRCNAEISNAIIDRNGFVKTKRGCKLIPRLSSDEVFGVSKSSNIRINNKPNAIQQRDIVRSRKLQNGSIVLYHGSDNPNLTPKYGYGSTNNDFGRGFYLAEDRELGKEWAYNTYHGKNYKTGYMYSYKIDLSSLSVLNFCELETVNWIAELAANRRITNVNNSKLLSDIIGKFVKNYQVESYCYDVVIGYRADDSYFNYVQKFLSNSLSLEALEGCMREGNLGLQVMIKSRKAFSALTQVGCESVPKSYIGKLDKRVSIARRNCSSIFESDIKFELNNKKRTKIVNLIQIS